MCPDKLDSNVVLNLQILMKLGQNDHLEFVIRIYTYEGPDPNGAEGQCQMMLNLKDFDGTSWPQ